ncbi:hypothetical protein PITC_082310 [Penicillium italicum]|uniref:Uncharacterized protein n=1 Tax=Penicillium italicum TaxID=40296 RepID=A0A0A2L697_PENIT|nr:hypothetical protein PITC_082310 [Penicillium italicum]
MSIELLTGNRRHLTWLKALVVIEHLCELISVKRFVELMPELRVQEAEIALEIIHGEAD